jgi:HSP20 family molecular chaperone IbpA
MWLNGAHLGPKCGVPRLMGGRSAKTYMSLDKGQTMSPASHFSSPLLLGFDGLEQLLDRLTKSSGDGYPPYNIERLSNGDGGELLRITLAVAGFTRDQLEIAHEENQLVIRGRQSEDKSRTFLHRGIAARQFQRSFVLADAIEVGGAELKDGLLSIDLVRHEPERLARKIDIVNS